MTSFLFATAAFVLVVVGLGLFRILYGPTAADRMMAAQIIGSGGVAVLLLLATATTAPPIVDVALMLALLASVASVAFVTRASGTTAATREGTDHR